MNSRPELREDEIIQKLINLSREPGIIFSYSLALVNNFFIPQEEIVNINWHERLSYQEMTFFLGLMVKIEIDSITIPSKGTAEKQIACLEYLFKMLQNTYTQTMLNNLIDNSPLSQGDKIDPVNKREFFVEPIFYGGSGAYDFQYLEFAKFKYSLDNEWLIINKGISIDQMTIIAEELKERHRLLFPNILRKQSFKQKCQTAFSILCFQQNDICSFESSIVDCFLNIFSLSPGVVNRNFDSVGSYNAVESHPIIRLTKDIYFLPIILNLTQSIYESPFYWMSADTNYRDTFFKNRGISTESLAHNLLLRVFGNNNLYRNVKVKRNNKEHVTDIDVLALAGSKAVIIQAKSKKLTELSKQGNLEQLRSDFQEAIQKAYDQALLCRKAILTKSNRLYTSAGIELKLSEPINDAYIMCLTIDYYPAVLHQVHHFLKKEQEDPFPLTISIFDLDLLSFYLVDPFDFLYYLRQRVNNYTHFRASSEMALLAHHLKVKLFPSKEAYFEFIDESYTQLIDANFPALRGYAPLTQDSQFFYHEWKNDKFNLLIKQIKASNNPGLTDALFFLFDMSGDGVNQLFTIIDDVRNMSIRDGKAHDCSVLFDDVKSGVSFMCVPGSVEKLNERLLLHASARKYKSKADIWLALGCIDGSPNYIDTIAFSSAKWKEDSSMDIISKNLLSGKARYFQNVAKVGRNAPCPCGSGKKFKYCCDKYFN